MPTALTTAPTTLDTGTGTSVQVTAAAANGDNVEILRGGASLGFLRAGQSSTYQPEGAALTARMASGTGSVDTITAGATSGAQTIAASGTAATLADGYSEYDVTLTGSPCVLTFPPARAGRGVRLAVRQDATGSRLVTWPGNVKWPLATAPVLTTTASRTDILGFTCVDGTNWLSTWVTKDVR